MPGSIDYTPGPTQLGVVEATTIGVFLYDDSQANGNRYTLLPNIPLRADPVQGRRRASFGPVQLHP